MRRLAAFLGLGLVSLTAPASTVAQQVVVARDVLDTLGLDSALVGRVGYFFEPNDEARAQALASLIERAAAHYERALDLRFEVSLAALGPGDWFSEFPGIPYAVPWASIPERILILPASLTEGVLIMGPDSLADRRRVDFVALHEYGHVAEKEYFRPAAPEPYSPVAWFRELIANYIAYGYVAEADSAWAEATRTEAARQIASFTPPVRSLDWSFMNSLDGPTLSRVYGWYQFVLNEQAAELYDRHGVALLPRLKSALRWDDAARWTPESLLASLEPVAPTLAAWARGFGRR